MASELWNAFAQYSFMQNALITCLLASIACGIIGVVIVEKKLVMMSGGIAHTAFGGIGLGYLIGFEPIYGAFLFSLLASAGIGVIKRKSGARADVLIALFWSAGMALGIIFMALMPGYPPVMSSYLFGSVLAVTRSDIWMVLGLTAVVLLAVIPFFSHWKAFLFDEIFAKIIGIKTVLFEYMMLALISITVVALIKVAGIILALTLLAAPAAIAGLMVKSLRARMLLAVALGIIITITGLCISYFLDMPSGASTAILAVAGYLLANAVGSLTRKILRRRHGRNAEERASNEGKSKEQESLS